MASQRVERRCGGKGVGSVLTGFYERLYSAFGPQNWWPGDGRFEVMVGAILTQNTAWTNVEKAIANLKGAGVLTPLGLKRVSMERLAELIRPAGYFNIKAKRLKAFVGYLFREHKGRIDGLSKKDTESLRRALLDIHGIGPETADSILLYALERPVFVIDAYTKRVLVRHGLVSERAGYDELRGLFMDNLPPDVGLFNEYHALFVRVGKEYCKTKPICKGCPLEEFL